MAVNMEEPDRLKGYFGDGLIFVPRMNEEQKGLG